MDKYVIPLFIPQRTTAAARRGREPQMRGMKPRIPDRVVAGIRWDYDNALMSAAAIARKYSLPVTTVRGIVYRTTRQGVDADKAASESFSNTNYSHSQQK